MTVDEKQKWLERIWEHEKIIKSLLAEKKKWRENLLNVTPRYEAQAHGSPDPHSNEAIYDRLIALEKEIDDNIDAQILARNEIMAAIEALPTVRQRLVLRYRYVNCWKWDRVAEELDYSVNGRKVYKLHTRALLNLEVGEK